MRYHLFQGLPPPDPALLSQGLPPPDPRFLSQGLPPLDTASSPGVGAPNTFLLQIQQLKQQIQLI